MEPWVVVLPFLGAALIGVFARLLRGPETWETVAEGALKRVEWREKTYSRRSGAMVHHTAYYTIRHNTLHFEGGTVLYGIRGVLKEPGTVLVRLECSNRGTYRLVRYK